VACAVLLGPVEMCLSNVAGIELISIVEEESEFWGIDCDYI
jgi:hypothetical protein